MAGLFNLNTISSALNADEVAISTTGQNVANASTAGYRDQTVVFQEVGASNGGLETGIVGPISGQGVTVSSIQQAQTGYLDSQINTASGQYGFSNSMNSVLQEVQSALGVSGTADLSSAMDGFFNSWSTLAASPTSIPDRASVVSAGQTLAETFQEVSQSIASAQTTTNQTIASDVGQVNQLASQIAALNGNIAQQSTGQNNVNDLMDQRDQLVNQLSSIANIQSTGTGANGVIISIGGKTLVQGTEATAIQVGQSNGQTTLTWQDDDTPVSITSGELGGLMSTANTVLPGYNSTLNGIASQLVTQVNDIHSKGTDGNGNQAGDFFVAGSDASDIAVNPSLVSSPAGVAASGNGTQGDNSVANDLANLSSISQSTLGNQTFGNSYAALVTQIGSDVQSSQSNATMQNQTVQQLTTQQSSISGVSIDQEMTNMTKYEQSYDAAARVFTIIDSMLSDVVNNLGNISEV